MSLPNRLNNSKSTLKNGLSTVKAGISPTIRRCTDERYFGLFSKFDAVLDVFACQPIVLGYELEDAQMELCGYTLLDEKMAGTFHIAVGANTMFGGESRATDHGDFVGRGEVEVLARGTTGYWRVKPE